MSLTISGDTFVNVKSQSSDVHILAGISIDAEFGDDVSSTIKMTGQTQQIVVTLLEGDESTAIGIEGNQAQIEATNLALQVTGSDDMGGISGLELDNHSHFQSQTLRAHVSGGNKAVGLDLYDGSTVSVLGKTSLVVTSNTGDSTGVDMWSSTADFQKQVTLIVRADNNAHGLEIFGADESNMSTINLAGLQASVTGSDAEGIFLDDANLKTTGDISLTVTATDRDDNATGLYQAAGESNFGGNLFITLADAGGVGSTGVHLDRNASATVNGELVIDMTQASDEATAISAHDSQMTVEGGVDIATNGNQYAIEADGAVITLKKANRITGNIVAEGSTIYAKFSGRGSFFKGQVLPESSTYSTAQGANTGLGVHLSFQEQAVWNVVGASTVASLKLSGASLVFDDTSASVKVTDSARLSGTNTVYVTGIADGQYLTLGNTLVSGDFKVVAAGSFNDNQTDLTKDVEKLAASIAGDAYTSQIQKVTLAEGQLYGETILTRNDAGYTVQSRKASTKLETLKNVQTLTALQWRHEINDLNERLGQLRDASKGIGSWARVYGSKNEYGTPKVTAQNTTLQVGSDVSVGNWTLGLAANYTDGESEYLGGATDSKSYGVVLYVAWMSETGAYVDLIAKYARMEADFTVKELTGSTDTNAVSFSAETGYRFEFVNDAVFVEPQVEVSYGLVGGDTYKTGYVEVDQESFYSLMGRVGVRTGFTFPNKKGTIFAKVSVMHEFGGEMESTVRNMNRMENSVPLKDNLGDTSFEFGIGANFAWTESTCSYFNLERSTGGDVNEKYRFNVGIRHVF